MEYIDITMYVCNYSINNTNKIIIILNMCSIYVYSAL